MSDMEQTTEMLAREHMLERILARDYTVFGDAPDEIVNRLGWLDCPKSMQANLPDLWAFANDVRGDGIRDVVLLGMGGSSLSAEVLQAICGNAPGYPKVQILDTTDPQTIAARERRLNLGSTLFIVATKSGGTVETLSLFKYFYRKCVNMLGSELASNQFVAITDPGSGLEKMANELGFRRTFLNDPQIGGRYSALSYFGMLPAALAGIDIEQLLTSAATEKEQSTVSLGAFLGSNAVAGRNKLTLIADGPLEPFGAWVEQLIAESSGKQGHGMLPVVGEPLLHIGQYGDDRCFVVLQDAVGSPASNWGERLAKAGQPVMALQFVGTGDLGAQFFRWELATAIACRIIGVNPFDQPDVERAKVIARDAMAEYAKSGQLPEQHFALNEVGVSLAGTSLEGNSLAEVFHNQLAGVKPGGYVCIQAFLPALQKVDSMLAKLAETLRRITKVPVVHGFGPRYLHSTGQLHKGGPAGGLYIQLTCDDPADLPIPDSPSTDASSASFGVLKRAQAHGDYHALENAGRTVLSCHLDDLEAGLARLQFTATNLQR